MNRYIILSTIHQFLFELNPTNIHKVIHKKLSVIRCIFEQQRCIFSE